jgi:hypothetical protein
MTRLDRLARSTRDPLNTLAAISEPARSSGAELGDRGTWKNDRNLNPRAWHSADMARIRISIVFESGARIGPGKAKLLESIRDTGSISAAARDMGMSYKRAYYEP